MFFNRIRHAVLGNYRNRLFVVMAVGLSVFLGDLGASLAQTIESITVTARKKDESFIDVPVSLQVFSKLDINRYKASSLTEIAEMANQVMLMPAGSGAGAAFVVRGISSSTLDPGLNTSVSIDIDGMQISRGRIVREAMFDIESIEILKGPQALFFGKNNSAGVVSINSAGPGTEWEFIAKVFYEFEADEFIGEAIISGPINDKVGIRLAYQGSTAQGWMKNVSGPIENTFPSLALEPFDFPGAFNDRKGDYSQHIARLTLQLDPSDAFTATFKIMGSSMNMNGTQLTEVLHCLGDFPVTNGLVDPTGDCIINGVQSQGAIPQEIRENFDGLEDRPNGDGFASYDSLLATLDMSYTWNNYVLSSITGVHAYDWFRWDNFDGTTFNQLEGIQDETSTVFSQEVRLHSTYDNPFNFMFGMFYERIDRDSDNQGKIAAVGVNPDNGFSNNWAGFSTVKGKVFSVFGQLIWDVTEDLELAAGARWSKVEKSMFEGILYSHPLLAGLFLEPGQLIEADFDDNNVSPEATITWHVRDNFTVYGAYKSDYKAGGFSTQTIINSGTTPESVVYQEEKAKGGEIGFKSTLMDNRMRLNGTIYYYNFDGIQDSVFNAAIVNFSIINADARAKGFDLDMNFAATDRLMLRAQVGYNEAKYRSFTNAPCYGLQTVEEGCHVNETGLGGPGFVQDLTGRTRLLAPKWSGSVGASYDAPISNDISFGLSGELIFTDSYGTQAALNPVAFQGSTVKINVAVRVYSDDDRWEVALIGRNLTNELMIANSADKPGNAGDVFGQILRGRQIGIEAIFRY